VTNFQSELTKSRENLITYAKALAAIAGVEEEEVKFMTEQFDVFLAHNSVDKPLVREISARLREQGLNPWLDEEQILPGQLLQEAIQKAIPHIKSAAIIIGVSGPGKWQIIELNTLTSQFIEQGVKIIPVLLPGVTDLPEKLLFLRQLNWVSFNEITDEDAFDRLIWGITGKKPQPKPIINVKYYHVFLCYQQADQFEIEPITRQLEKNEISFYPNQRELDTNIDAGSLAVFIGNNGLPWENEEQEDLIWNFVEKGHTVVPVILSGTLQNPKFPPYLKRRQVIDFRQNNPELIFQFMSLISKDYKKRNGSIPIMQ